MNSLMITYYKEQGIYSIFYKRGKHVVVTNSRATTLLRLLNGNNLHWRANLKWSKHYLNCIEMFYDVEKR